MASRDLAIVLRLQDKVTAELKGVAGKLDDLGEDLQTVGRVGAVGFAAVGGGIAYSLKQAFEAETAFKRFELVFKNTSKATDEQVRSLVELAKAQQRIGVVADDVQLVMLEELASFGLTYDSLQKLLPAANDFAVALHGVNPSAEQAKLAMTGLGKVMQGQFEILTKKGFKFTEDQKALFESQGNEAQKTTELIKILNENYGLLNEKSRETAEGGLFALNTQFSEIGESLGNAILPAVTSLQAILTPVLEKIGEWIDKNPELAAKIAIVAVAVTGAMVVLGALGAAISGVVALFTALGGILAFIVSPIGLVVIAVGALIAAGVYLWKNWETVKAKANELKQSIVSAFNGMVSDAKSAFQSLYANSIGKLEELWNKAKELAGKIRKAISEAFDKDKRNSPSISDRLRELSATITGNLDGIKVGASSWATDTRHTLSSGLSGSGDAPGGLSITITGNTLLDSRAAEKMGDLIVQRLRLNYQQ